MWSPAEQCWEVGTLRVIRSWELHPQEWMNAVFAGVGQLLQEWAPDKRMSSTSFLPLFLPHSQPLSFCHEMTQQDSPCQTLPHWYWTLQPLELWKLNFFSLQITQSMEFCYSNTKWTKTLQCVSSAFPVTPGYQTQCSSAAVWGIHNQDSPCPGQLSWAVEVGWHES
jgi:hypothetical protein